MQMKDTFWKKLPIAIRVILILIFVVTVVYWIFFLLYHLINLVRALIHFITEKKHFWVFIFCIVICCIVALLFAQFYFNLDPFGKAYNWALETIQKVRDYFASIVSGRNEVVKCLVA